MSENAINLSLMRRAIDLAMRGRGFVEPNPMVGCVIVKDNRLLGEGYHQRFGQPHAEPNALAACTESPHQATAYVTLEPCCHTDKKTPPCVPRLVEAQIARVVVGCLDPNPQVNGQGIALLRHAGIEVITGVLEKECRQLIAPFIASAQLHRPYITLKWAQSANGKVAGANGSPIQISSEWSTKLVHALRGRCDCVVVGINTVLTDDPLLTVRHAIALRPSTRYVLDRRLRLPPQSRLAQTARQSPVVVATDHSHLDSSRAAELRALGVEIIAAASLPEVIADWHRRRFTHVLVEPGPTLASALIGAGYADRLWIITSSKNIPADSAPAAFPVPDHFRTIGEHCSRGDRIKEYLNSQSPVFFTPDRSADFRDTT